VPFDPQRLGRSDRLDALRGLAIVWMAVFHFCFDLNHYGWLQPRQNFYADPFWTLQRTAIVSLFLFCAGLSLAVALDAGQGWGRFWRRWAQVAGCAVLVSLGSALMFPHSWISFGVLHGIALMLVLARLLAPVPAGLLVLLGALALLLLGFVTHPVFDTRWANWVGLVARKPVTEDYVPLLPWWGVMLWGQAAGRWLLARRAHVLSGRLLPSTLLTYTVARWGEQRREQRGVRAFTEGMAPVTIGLLLATSWILTEPTRSSPVGWLLFAATVAWMLKTRWSPLWPIAAGAAAGALGWV